MSIKTGLALVVSLSLAAVAFGAETKIEPAKPFALTEKEISDGRLLLFDGLTTFGWTTEGEVGVANGVLTIGGAKASSVRSNVRFGPGELRFRFRMPDRGVE